MRRFLPPVLLAIALLGSVASVVLVESLGRNWMRSEGSGAAILSVSFAVVGFILTVKRPGHLVGWILLIAGAANGINASAGYLGALGAREGWGVAKPAAWVGAWIWTIGAAGFPALLAFYPSGKLPSPRWRWLPIFIVTGVGMAISATALATWSLPAAAFGIETTPDAASQGALGTINGLGMGLLALSLLGSLLSLVVRFRRAARDERQQMKWLMFAGLMTIVVLFSVSPAAPVRVGGVLQDLAIFALPSLPAAVGIAVLRYRLYDLDLVVNKTLVYATLTALLAGAYVGGVALLQLLLPVSGDNQFVVAATTLAVAALFNPARVRVQAAIDRLFYRSRYDAQQTVDTFRSRLRDEVDIEAVTSELLTAVQASVGPRSATLWLRGPVTGERSP